MLNGVDEMKNVHLFSFLQVSASLSRSNSSPDGLEIGLACFRSLAYETYQWAFPSRRAYIRA